jgi:hypothetical protein
MIMQTFNEMHAMLNASGNPCGYWGEHGDWLVAMGQHRDSDILTRCNWKVLIRRLDALELEDAYVAESESHWAVGWVEHLLINPACQAAIDIAESALEAIEDYPALDDEAWSEMEHDEAWESWQSWGHRDFVDMLEREFGLSGSVVDLLMECEDELYTYLSDESGEPYTFDNSGCSFGSKLLVDDMDRDAMNKLIRQLRNKQAAE